jgi:hypothetical protein
MNDLDDDVATATRETTETETQTQTAKTAAADATATLVGASERLTRTVVNGMAEMAGNIAGTVAAALAAPLTVAAAVAQAQPQRGLASSANDASGPSPADEEAAARSTLETGEPPDGSEPSAEPSRDIPG